MQMNAMVREFDVLGRKQLAVQEGIELLQQARRDLVRSQSAANAWGAAAILANATLVPLNCIVNAFELKAASSAYRAVVRALYDQYGKSGTRTEGHARAALSLLKDVTISELKRKGMTEFVPGVNVLVGLAEDSIATWQTMNMVNSGTREINTAAAQLDLRINRAIQELRQLGIRRAQLHDRMASFSRTA